ncbi:hypothetical protein DY000_02039574 [Brassica cretica]|uniref:Uncharacterized protein n=1 Tax=Brassica cretica TaxID=69181 RepID=A0ABQ7BDF5_BRACR|nr:hypothetical protein DY000_02039574 [Brassica cretica]
MKREEGLPSFPIWQAGMSPSRSSYGELRCPRPARHMADQGRSRRARHSASGTSRHMASWDIYVPLAEWRARLHRTNIAHSRLVFVDFSFELCLYFFRFVSIGVIVGTLR